MSRADLWGLPSPEHHGEFYADLPTKRLVAFFFDAVVIGAVTLVLIPFTAFTALFYLPFLALLVSFVYRTLTIASGSATWGMRLVAIELRNHRGERLDPITAAAHTALYLAIFSTVLPLAISVVLMLATPRRQGLHDMALGTAAINRAALA
jgi:uncharacterized RDD family membrane protein YckC